MEEDEAPKTDSEKIVERILKLIRRRNRGKKEPELTALVEDFHKEYQALHAQYDLLKQEADKRDHDGKGNESCSIHATSSDSEYFSSDDIQINSAFNYNRSPHIRMTGSMEEELKRAYVEVADLKHQLASMTEEKEALASDHLVALSKIQEIETISRDISKEVNEKESSFCGLEKGHNGRIAELEEQLTGLQNELESQDHPKRISEDHLNVETTETKQQGETNKALHVQILVEEDEINELTKQIKDNENNLTSKIEDSMAQVCNLKKEVAFLRAQKCESGGSVACKTNESFDQENILKQELDSLRSQKVESDTLLERKSQEISQYMIQVKSLKEELVSKSAAEQIIEKEKKCLQVQVMDLESEVGALCEQKNRSEDELRSNINEINQLREEKSNLNARVLELEALFCERELELSALHEDNKNKRIKETAQVTTLNVEVEVLQQKLDSMKIEKSKLELQIADQQRISKEKEESNTKSMESSSKLATRLSAGSVFNYNTLERKMEDLAQEFRKNAEDNIRLLYQRITVAEKIHYENKENYKKIKESLEQENGALEQKLKICEAELKKLRDTTEPDKNASTGLNSVSNNKLEDDGNSVTCTSEVAPELVSANDSDEGGRENGTEKLKSAIDVELVIAEMDKENEELKEKVMNLEAKLKSDIDVKLVVARMDKENEELKEKVMNLEAKLSEEGEEKLNLLKTVSELENRAGELEKVKKEKEEMLLGREEEKREAIRQLCLLIDYHRGRCDHLKELIFKFSVRSNKNK